MANLIKALKDLVDTVTRSFNDLREEEIIGDSERQRCLWVCTETIDYFNTILRDPQTTVHVRRSIQAHITYLNWIADQFSRIGIPVVGGDLGVQNQGIKWEDLENAFTNNIRTGCVINQTHTDLRVFLQTARKLIIEKVQSTLRDLAGLKVNIELSCIFHNTKNGEAVEEAKSFNTKAREILPATPLADWYAEHVHDKLLRKVEDFNGKDSGWSLTEINSLVITMSRYTPTQVGNSTFVKLPNDIQKKNAVLNIQNNDEFCFLWCVNAALHPPTANPERTSQYRHFSVRLNYEGIQFPIKLNDIPKFESMNNLRINVYGLESEITNKKSEKNVVIPLYLSDAQSKIDTIHLLMIQKNVDYTDNLDKIESVYHFAWIRNLSRLISKQISKGKHKLYFCDRCLNHFKLEKCSKEHVSDCFKANKVRMQFPIEKNKILKFKDFKSKDTMPFVVYADLECTLEPQGDDEKKLHKHVSHSIAYYVHCSYDSKLSKFELKRSPDCIEWFA